MSDQAQTEKALTGSADLRDIVRQAINEFVHAEQRKAEPAYKTELQEERKRREQLEARLNQLAEENRKARAAAEEADRHSQIRNELQKMGVAKLDLAFRAVKDEFVRAEDGRLHTKADGKSLQEYVVGFVQENPELLPARIAGGSGAQNPNRGGSQSDVAGLDLDKIRPGMNKEELERVRQHISKLASQALRGV